MGMPLTGRNALKVHTGIKGIFFLTNPSTKPFETSPRFQSSDKSW